jgi:hypothetical protein
MIGYGLDDQGSPGRTKKFLHIAQTDSGPHSASYPMGTGGSYAEGKAAEALSWSLTSN